MTYIQQPSRICLKTLELLNAVRTRILLWIRLHSQEEKVRLKFDDKEIKNKAEYYKQNILLHPHADR